MRDGGSTTRRNVHQCSYFQYFNIFHEIPPQAKQKRGRRQWHMPNKHICSTNTPNQRHGLARPLQLLVYSAGKEKKQISFHVLPRNLPVSTKKNVGTNSGIRSTSTPHHRYVRERSPQRPFSRKEGKKHRQAFPSHSILHARSPGTSPVPSLRELFKHHIQTLVAHHKPAQGGFTHDKHQVDKKRRDGGQEQEDGCGACLANALIAHSKHYMPCCPLVFTGSHETSDAC